MRLPILIEHGCLNRNGAVAVGITMWISAMTMWTIVILLYFATSKLMHEKPTANRRWYFFSSAPTALSFGLAYFLAVDSRHENIITSGITYTCSSKDGSSYESDISLCLWALALYFGAHVLLATLTGATKSCATFLFAVGSVIGLFNHHNHAFDSLIIGLNTAVAADLIVSHIESFRERSVRAQSPFARPMSIHSGSSILKAIASETRLSIKLKFLTRLGGIRRNNKERDELLRMSRSSPSGLFILSLVALCLAIFKIVKSE